MCLKKQYSSKERIRQSSLESHRASLHLVASLSAKPRLTFLFIPEPNPLGQGRAEQGKVIQREISQKEEDGGTALFWVNSRMSSYITVPRIPKTILPYRGCCKRGPGSTGELAQKLILREAFSALAFPDEHAPAAASSRATRGAHSGKHSCVQWIPREFPTGGPSTF